MTHPAGCPWRAVLRACCVVIAFAKPVHAQAGDAGLFFVGAEAGGGLIAGDAVATVGASAGFDSRPFAMRLRVPLTLRIVDVAPTSSGCGPLRCEEWLEGGALSLPRLARVVDGLRVLSPQAPFTLRAGNLAFTLGRGVLVDGVSTGSDWDRRTSGVYARVGIPWHAISVEAFVRSALAPQELAGARAELAPLAADARVDAEGLERVLQGIRVGVDLAADATAPRGVATDATGALLRDAVTSPYGGLGCDVSVPLIATDATRFTPYLAASLLGVSTPAPLGVGAVAGIWAQQGLGPVVVRLDARALMDGPGHRSAPFATLYDVDRRRVPLADGAQREGRAALFANVGAASVPVAGGIGGAARVEAVAWRLISLFVAVHGDPTPSFRRAELGGAITADSLAVRVRVIERAFTTPAQAFAFDARTVAVLEGSWRFIAPFAAYVRAAYAPRFRAVVPLGAHAGDPASDLDVTVGVLADLGFGAP